MLAAGAGRRFGGEKLTAAWRGGALVDGALAAAFAAPARSVILVWGANAKVPAVARACAERLGQAGRLRLVEAADHAEGKSASFRAAIAAQPADAAGAFVFLGDMPRIPHAVLAPLAAALASGALAAAPLWRRRRGHPVLFARELFADLAALHGDQGARALLSRLGPRLVTVPTPDDGVLFDVDQPEDLAWC